jgi:penicillin-binding protein 1C
LLVVPKRLRNKRKPVFPLTFQNNLQTLLKGILHIFRRRKFLLLFLLAASLAFYLCLPEKLFHEPYSTVIEDRDGKLLGARISDDGQWRFTPADSIPGRFMQCLLLFEDRRFLKHPGIDPFAIGRAFRQNIRAGHIVSGGSTLSMQVIRLARKGKSRTLPEKVLEMILALRLEMRYSKQEILVLYCSQAPFGGNVVGLEAASWRYFGRDPFNLSWAESATLAVLPNSPSLIYPGKNRKSLLAKRNHLLDKLLEKQLIDTITNELSKLELLPGRPLPLPQLAPHLLARLHNLYPGCRIRTSLEYQMQQRVAEIVELHHKALSSNGINNAAALVCEVESGEVMAYVGNISSNNEEENGQDVDIITSARSTGSLLKPLLFASMLDNGELLPGTLVPDIPTQIAGFSPKNFEPGYDGAVYARRALARSLNVPAVRMLQQHGLEKFHHFLRTVGFRHISYPADHYGLSLILGGAEASLWELTNVYESFGRVLNHFYQSSGRYYTNDFHEAKLILGVNGINRPDSSGNNLSPEPVNISAGPVWFAFEAMNEVNRPDAEANWQYFSSKHKIAWKTGTSFGNRDGWAIGTTPRYVVGVWTGNADGEGRPLLTGVGCAAPVMFDIFDILPYSGWFNEPFDDMERVAVCHQSGYRAGPLCEDVDTVLIQKKGLTTAPCPYHFLVHLSSDMKFRVNSNCEDISSMVHKSWFVLPPVMEYYFKFKNAGYKLLPPYKQGCSSEQGISSMELVYPRPGSRIYLPKGLTGEKSRLVLEAVHRSSNAIIYWHLDEIFLGSTRRIHQMQVQPGPGKHILNLVDEQGETLSMSFEAIEQKE